MTESGQNIIISVWNDMVLRRKLENNPYSLTRSELASLQNNDFLKARLEHLSHNVLTHEILVENFKC